MRIVRTRPGAGLALLTTAGLIAVSPGCSDAGHARLPVTAERASAGNSAFAQAGQAVMDSTSAGRPVSLPVTGQAELGKVRWGRDPVQAKQESARSGKPLLILFQEVPG
jgi:hypothetical protein